MGFSVILDDREESPGRKFNDADLIGIPLRVVIGKRTLAQGKVEIKERKSGAVFEIPKEDLIVELSRRLRDAREVSVNIST